MARRRRAARSIPWSEDGVDRAWSKLIHAGAGGQRGDADQLAAAAAEDIAAGVGETAFAAVERLHALRIVAVVERDPALARLVADDVVRAANQPRHLVHGHADGQPRELAARG